jgi:hypothetical protein
MSNTLDELLEHDLSDDCPICRAQDIVDAVLVPAAAAWETRNELPRYSVALHGAAGLLGAMMDDGVPREAIDDALRQLLDEIEQGLAEDKAMGGPPQGTA